MPILYKYLPPERTDILTSGFIMLTRPRLFNDPFELKPHYESLEELQLSTLPNATPAQIEWIKKEQKNINDKAPPPSAKATILENATQTIVVLSLAENRASVLMWAHYAAAHTGFLIGFDSEQKILAIDSPHRHMDKVKQEREQRRSLMAFRVRLLKRWGGSLNQLDLPITVAREFGSRVGAGARLNGVKTPYGFSSRSAPRPRGRSRATGW